MNAAGGDLELAGGLSGSFGLAKSGDYALALTGANTYEGDTVVNAGTLLVSGSSANSAHVVAGGATLMGAGTVGDLAVNGTVSPGNAADTPATLACGVLTLGNGGTYVVDLSQLPANGTKGVDWDLIEATSNAWPGAGETFTIRVVGTPPDFQTTGTYTWQVIAGASGAGFDASRFVIDVSGFGGNDLASKWSFFSGSGYLKYDGSDPTAVVLYTFTAGAEDGQVVVRWRTASEANTVGFWVERKEGEAWVRVNSEIVYAQGDGMGASYSLVDAGAESGGTYTYRLVEVETAGEQVYGPFERTATELGFRALWRWMGTGSSPLAEPGGRNLPDLRSTNISPATPPENEYRDEDAAPSVRT